MPSPLNRAPAKAPIVPNDVDDAGFTLGPTSLPIDANAAGGAAPKDHRDAVIVKIAAAETNGEYSAAPDANNPDTLRRVAGGAFLSATDLHGGE